MGRGWFRGLFVTGREERPGSSLWVFVAVTGQVNVSDGYNNIIVIVSQDVCVFKLISIISARSCNPFVFGTGVGTRW